jgi:hypothetical protein
MGHILTHPAAPFLQKTSSPDASTSTKPRHPTRKIESVPPRHRFRLQLHSRIATGATCFLICILLAAAASASVSTDSDFVDVAAKISSWSKGTLGSILRLGSLLIGSALAIKTQRLPIAMAVALVSVYFPDVVDVIFGAVV